MINLPEFRSGLLIGLLGQTHLFEDVGHQAPIGESALQQVETYEGGEPEKLGTDVVGEREAGQDEGPRDYV